MAGVRALGLRDIVAKRCGAALVAAGLLAGAASAAPGDVHRVTGERVNLRAGPSDDANVRGQVVRGDELLELTRQGDWIGVRSVSSGVEGWIYGGLTEIAARSTLGGAGGEGAFGQPQTAGFQSFSPEFDTLLASIGQHMGMRLFETVERGDDGVLRLTPTREFLSGAGQEAHLLAALAVQQMWKNFNNGRPVRVTMAGERGRDYLSLSDTGPRGPALEITDWGRAAFQQGQGRQGTAEDRGRDR